MAPEKTRPNWHKVSDGLPAEAHGYGRYSVATVLVNLHKPEQHHGMAGSVKAENRVLVAQLYYFGGDPARPFWKDLDGNIIESETLRVTHWAPNIEGPVVDG